MKMASNFYSCSEDGCKYETRLRSAIIKHTRKTHGKVHDLDLLVNMNLF